MAKKETTVFLGTGRRKSSIARVRIMPGKGNLTVNETSLEEYLPTEVLRNLVKMPFDVTGTNGKFDMIAKVEGGGLSGQAGAIRHGLARALVNANEESVRYPIYVGKAVPAGARKAPQFSKR